RRTSRLDERRRRPSRPPPHRAPAAGVPAPQDPPASSPPQDPAADATCPPRRSSPAAGGTFPPRHRQSSPATGATLLLRLHHDLRRPACLHPELCRPAQKHFVLPPQPLAKDDWQTLPKCCRTYIGSLSQLLGKLMESTRKRELKLSLCEEHAVQCH
uniref:Uncharacterized protein n=2 Tax=Aegilops tauschii subsp. strangulata TaxID=200361 RepID=A0A453DE20_AEGTS